MKNSHHSVMARQGREEKKKYCATSGVQFLGSDLPLGLTHLAQEKKHEVTYMATIIVTYQDWFDARGSGYENNF